MIGKMCFHLLSQRSLHINCIQGKISVTTFDQLLLHSCFLWIFSAMYVCYSKYNKLFKENGFFCLFCFHLYFCLIFFLVLLTLNFMCVALIFIVVSVPLCVCVCVFARVYEGRVMTVRW